MRKWMGLGALALGTALLAGIVPVAMAGPQEDTEQAVKEFERGNLVGAMQLWRKAAEAGHAPAQVWLGEILDKSEEDEEAFTWYRKAADQGDAGGEFGLGQMYAKGEGVKQDNEKARAHILRAAEKNHLSAAIAMRDIYKNGTYGVAVDRTESEKWDAKVKEILGPDHPSLKPVAEESASGKKKRR